MNKSEIIKAVAGKIKEKTLLVERVINCFLDQMRKALRKGEPVGLQGFGSFRRHRIKPRKVWGNKEIPARYRIYFRAGIGTRSIQPRTSPDNLA